MNARTLKLSKDVNFPLSLVTASGVIYGGKGMGKSSLGIGVIPEELDHAGLKFSLIDPMGVGYGLQHGADRESKGLEVLIIGGKHGDIEIEPTSGAVVADLVVDEHVSTVIDISRHKNGKMWSKAEKIRFVADYCTRLYERQGEKMEPILLIIDEAGRFCPQMIPHGSPDLARCVGAIEQLVEEGRNVAIGCLLITQRSARMNKSVSELADYMIAFRTVGPNSVNAIMDWLGEHVEKVRHKEIVAKLRELPVGSALVVSPGYLKHEGIVRFRARHTFDSSATPKAGEVKRAPGAASKPDLKKYRERMAQTIEKAQLNDPSKLKHRLATALAEIARLTKLKAIPAPAAKAVAPGRTETKIVEVPVFAKRDLKTLLKIAEGFAKAEGLLKFVPDLKVAADTGVVLATKVRQMVDFSSKIVPLAKDKIDVEARRAAAKPVGVAHVVALHRAAGHAVPALTSRNVSHTEPVAAVLTNPSRFVAGGNSGQDRMLEAVARRHPEPLSRVQVATISGLSHTSGTFTTYLSRMVKAGLIETVGQQVRLTQAGAEACEGVLGQAQSRDEVLALWQKSLGGSEWRMLQTLLNQEVVTNFMSREDLAGAMGLVPTSGTFTTYLSRLRRNALIEEQGAQSLRAAEALWPEGVAA